MSDAIVDYAVFVSADLCGGIAPRGVEVEVGSGRTLLDAVHLAWRYSSARVIEAWQAGGQYHYGLDRYQHGPVQGTRPPVESFTGQGFRRG